MFHACYGLTIHFPLTLPFPIIEQEKTENQSQTGKESIRFAPLHSLTLRQLRVFCTVARLLSYTKAAGELGCQQPTVSALVADLERTTQLTLFEQQGKRLTLTDEGRELYAHTQQIVAAADEAWQ